jgi:transposase
VGGAEQAVKVEDVILRAMAKKITWSQAAEVLGISESTMLRRLTSYKQRGYDPRWQRGRPKTGLALVRLAIAEKILALCQQDYMGLDINRFHKKLKQIHGIRVDYAWLKQFLSNGGSLRRTYAQYLRSRTSVGLGFHRMPNRVRARSIGGGSDACSESGAGAELQSRRR